MPLLWVAVIMAEIVLRSVTINHCLYSMHQSSSKLKIILRYLIYNKYQRIDVFQLNKIADTTLVNFVTVDVTNLASGIGLYPKLLAGCLLLMSQMYYLTSLGQFLIGMILLVIIYFVTLFAVYKKSAVYRMRLLHQVDDVSKQLDEFATNTSSIKLNGMEKLFFKSIIHLKASKSKYFERFLGWLFIGDIVNRAFPTIFGIAFYSIGFLLISDFKESMPL